jgi:hypothetical protein
MGLEFVLVGQVDEVADLCILPVLLQGHCACLGHCGELAHLLWLWLLLNEYGVGDFHMHPLIICVFFILSVVELL